MLSRNPARVIVRGVNMSIYFYSPNPDFTRTSLSRLKAKGTFGTYQLKDPKWLTTMQHFQKN